MNKQIMDEITLKRTVMRISHEIVEKNKDIDNIVLVGVKRRGVTLAKMIRDNICKIEKTELPCESLDIHFYRDDLSRQTDMPIYDPSEKIDVTGKNIIIVDDVLYTGRTVRAAIEAVFSMGRPAKIQLAILIDRGHRELPLRADYVGKSIPTSRKETISVKVAEFDGETGVELIG
ncbi:MAG: bifunctional pyr operon transcriptional regulator/uracil phosphoribosyltransferase PyrR [Clostridia bacterium]|nr:bifunctional pyr operon transcriptional regulator/uracil phosphoribosyltransferase PyrR [Clostridia bacterium]